jgi:hypothetical protein
MRSAAWRMSLIVGAIKDVSAIRLYSLLNRRAQTFLCRPSCFSVMSLEMRHVQLILAPRNSRLPVKTILHAHSHLRVTGRHVEDIGRNTMPLRAGNIMLVSATRSPTGYWTDYRHSNSSSKRTRLSVTERPEASRSVRPRHKRCGR